MTLAFFPTTLFKKGPNFRFQKEANAEPYIVLFG